LALALFFGDEVGALAAFGVDAVAAVLVTGLFAPRHHCRPVGVGRHHVWQDVQLTGGLGQCRKHAGAMGFGDVGVPGRGSQHEGAVGQLLLGPAGVESLDQMMAPNARTTF